MSTPNKQTNKNQNKTRQTTNTHTHTLNKTSIRHGIKTSYTCFCYLRQLDKNDLFSIKLEPKKNLAFCKNYDINVLLLLYKEQGYKWCCWGTCSM